MHYDKCTVSDTSWGFLSKEISLEKMVATSVKVFQWKLSPDDLEYAPKRDELIQQNIQHELPAVP